MEVDGLRMRDYSNENPFHTRAHCLGQILKTCLEAQTLSPHTLAEQFQTSVRTIQRDLKLLKMPVFLLKKQAREGIRVVSITLCKPSGVPPEEHIFNFLLSFQKTGYYSIRPSVVKHYYP